MVSHVVLKPTLDQDVAERIAVPAVRRALDALTDASQRNAPPVKVWVSMRDDRVRPAHIEADSQMIPANLRFRLDNGLGGVDLARAPRDPSLPARQAEGCRCDDPTLAEPLRDSITNTGVTLVGTRAQGSVETRFPRAAESEFGTTEDTAAHYMTNALREVAARLSSGASR